MERVVLALVVFMEALTEVVISYGDRIREDRHAIHSLSRRISMQTRACQALSRRLQRVETRN